MSRARSRDVQIAALLAALRTRGETLDELIGAAAGACASWRCRCPRRPPARSTPAAPAATARTRSTSRPSRRWSWRARACRSRSTATARPRAAAAAPSCSRRSASRSTIPPSAWRAPCREIGIGFLYARACHPAMARVAPVRAALGVRTLFNRLGPLTNPMRVRRQLVGVAIAALLEPTLAALVELGAERVWVVHGEDGLDELSLSAPTRVAAPRRTARARSFVVAHGEIVPARRARGARGRRRGGERAHCARGARGREGREARRGAAERRGGALRGRTRARRSRDGAKLAAESLDERPRTARCSSAASRSRRPRRDRARAHSRA